MGSATVEDAGESDGPRERVVEEKFRRGGVRRRAVAFGRERRGEKKDCRRALRGGWTLLGIVEEKYVREIVREGAGWCGSALLSLPAVVVVVVLLVVKVVEEEKKRWSGRPRGRPIIDAIGGGGGLMEG